MDTLEDTEDKRSAFLRVIRDSYCWVSWAVILAPSDWVLDREFRGRKDFHRGSSSDVLFLLESSSVSVTTSIFSFLILK